MNAIRAIHPYRHEGLWVFDDETVGLRQEPFVAGGDGGLGGGGTAAAGAHPYLLSRALSRPGGGELRVSGSGRSERGLIGI